MSRSIMLRPGFEAIVDDEDYEELIQSSWHLTKRGETYYAMRMEAPYYMHRVLLNTPPLLTVDHVNGNGLDNQRANLRPATRSQQRANSRSTRKNQFKGVTQQDTRWRAKAGKNYLGLFETPEAAARAYNEEAIKLWGEYAKLNVVDSWDLVGLGWSDLEIAIADLLALGVFPQLIRENVNRTLDQLTP